MIRLLLTFATFLALPLINPAETRQDRKELLEKQIAEQHEREFLRAAIKREREWEKLPADVRAKIEARGTVQP